MYGPARERESSSALLKNKKTDEHLPFFVFCFPGVELVYVESKLNYSSEPSWSRHQVVIRLKKEKRKG